MNLDRGRLLSARMEKKERAAPSPSRAEPKFLTRPCASPLLGDGEEAVFFPHISKGNPICGKRVPFLDPLVVSLSS